MHAVLCFPKLCSCRFPGSSPASGKTSGILTLLLMVLLARNISYIQFLESSFLHLLDEDSEDSDSDEEHGKLTHENGKHLFNLPVFVIKTRLHVSF